jgi:hypothetical protein
MELEKQPRAEGISRQPSVHSPSNFEGDFMTVVLKGERKIQVGGVTFTVRRERLGDYLLGRKTAAQECPDIDGKSVAAYGFAIIPRIVEMEGVSLPDGSKAEPTPENLSELFESNPNILMDLVTKVFFDEASASGNLESSQPGNGDMTRESAKPVEELPPAEA